MSSWKLETPVNCRLRPSRMIWYIYFVLLQRMSWLEVNQAGCTECDFFQMMLRMFLTGYKLAQTTRHRKSRRLPPPLDFDISGHPLVDSKVPCVRTYSVFAFPSPLVCFKTFLGKTKPTSSDRKNFVATLKKLLFPSAFSKVWAWVFCILFWPRALADCSAK